jgi:hypothetical protein
LGVRYLIGQRHRQIVLGHLPQGGRMLEWGSGTSTTWFTERLPEGARLLSIEHDAGWHRRVCESLSRGARAQVLLRPATGPLGPNASIAEERPDLLESYVQAADRLGPFDVILIDGVARGACLERAASLLAPEGVVFLHDAQRPWYDRAKARLTAIGTCGSCGDYPGPHLWWGGSAQTASQQTPRGVLPLIVSGYTVGTPYEAEAERLRASLDRLGLEHELVPLPDRGSWNANCGLKPGVLRGVRERRPEALLWLDADAVVHAPPTLLAGEPCDFAVQMCDGWIMNSATVYLGPTPEADELLADWADRCEREPAENDQVHLDRAWEAVSRRMPLLTRWLPFSYAKIFDRQDATGAAPVIEQLQASRRLGGPRESRPPTHDESVRLPRLARRPRESLVAHTWHEPDAPQPPSSRPPGTDASLPEPIKLALADRIALELIAAGVRSVAVFGAGRVTRQITGPAFEARGLRIAAVLDDHAAGSECLGMIVTSPALAAAAPTFGAVVASSDAWEDEVFASATRWFCETGVPVLRVFGWSANPGLAPAAVPTLGC